MNVSKYIVFILICASSQLFAKAILTNNYSALSEITFVLYDDNVPDYTIPENLKSTEEVLMYDVLHAVWLNNKWIAYTLNKNLLGTYKVGSPAMMDNDAVKKIFFVANFPGSRGGTDIYTAEFKDGAWSKPKNMGDAINTTYNEANPGLLDENILTFSSNGVIKKYDLKTASVEELSSATKQPEETMKQTVKEEPALKQEKVETTEEPVKEEPVETTKQPEPAPVVSTPSSSTAPSVFTTLGKKGTEAMKSTYKNAIQLGVFGNPNWSQLEQFSKFGKLITFKNEKDLNPVWVTGFASLTDAENNLQQIRLIPDLKKRIS